MPALLPASPADLRLGELCGSGRDTGPVLVTPDTGAPRGRADTPRHPPMGLMAFTGGTVALQ